MNRMPSLALSMMAGALFACLNVNGAYAQAAQPATPPQEQAKPETQPAGKDAKTAEAEENPFAPEPAPTLPPGMTGSDVNDPRFKLGAGLYDAGEVSMGMKHLELFKKPDAFQLGSADADDPRVQKTIAQLGVGGNRKIPKPIQLVIAQRAFANSDLAFEGSHLFQGNFYGVNIYDISHPTNMKLLTSMVCPGGQGDVSVYKNLLFMSVEMPNGRLDCGVQGFPPDPAPAEDDKDKAKDKDAAKDADKATNADKDKDKAAASDNKDKKDEAPQRKRRLPSCGGPSPGRR